MENGAAASKKKVVIVVVEDDPYVLDFLRMSLEKQGYEVQTAEDGEQGLALIQACLPVLVVMDLMLPKMDGAQILRRMSEAPVTAAIPVVVVSAYAASESMRRVIKSQKNVCEIFAKPLRTEEFLGTLKKLLHES